MADGDDTAVAKVEVVSPKDTSAISDGPVASLRSSLEARADPDAQNTVTDFIDFTEYLPADIVRSLTLIGKLDETYHEASLKVDDLTKTWARLPTIPSPERPAPLQLRADISRHLKHAVDSRTFAHTEAVRMSESVDRHYFKAKVLLEKLQTMMDSYPTEDQKSSPTEAKSPQMTRAKLAVRPTGEDGKKISRRRVPRITVPGEVLAPYDIEYDTFSDDSDISTDEDSDTATSRRTPGPPKIKLITSRGVPKTISRSARSLSFSSPALTAAAAANAAALLHPPPQNAVVGSKDAPWLQLTQYELAVLRKRMKKNAAWAPSETMIARELKALGRGPEAYREAKKKAEDEGRVFDAQVPALVTDDESGSQQLPAGAISAELLDATEVPTSNKGMKLNEAKKLKREALAKQAAEEAEESERKMREAAQLFLHTDKSSSEKNQTSKSRSGSRNQPKRKRDGDAEEDKETSAPAETPRNTKRTKIETPVLPPRHPSFNNETSTPSSVATPSSSLPPPATQTPVPIPIYTRSASAASATDHATPTVTTSVPVKPPAQTPVPLPKTEQRHTVTPVYPPVRDIPSREAKKTQLVALQPQAQPQPELGSRRSVSRGVTPSAEPTRRPGSRGKTMSQEPPSSLASDRPRRASTTRNTPVPEARPPARRAKRPAPGIVSTTSSGGNSAVGKRKAAPKKKARALKKDRGHGLETEIEMEEVDDEGNPIDPNEPRYCVCNGVSFGTMILCENSENCKYEWFHLGCVGLDEVPARTTKWYCPDCRRLLNIGERGEVSARGVRK
ncbi:PHD finger domain protein [Cordyceps fumosorosea ARSEF 2679]|uniref:PHD finger domain protein n=1 Tax=Cordyceps fumosorosea (strain ARSEF 2679) TaxID=1081104 RepID=A0A168EKN0_CORFA|nr:PHD finger domain protein [Cordyceps fumosorosea ARSEF 2679]OAA73927.1 PHD finger domain protein [Cordyceps fumosorosea ARSEF 2679]